jgi:hypothetical protein
MVIAMVSLHYHLCSIWYMTVHHGVVGQIAEAEAVQYTMVIWSSNAVVPSTWCNQLHLIQRPAVVVTAKNWISFTAMT